jgi:hypothetical protein
MNALTNLNTSRRRLGVAFQGWAQLQTVLSKPLAEPRLQYVRRAVTPNKQDDGSALYLAASINM